ncbi:MAG: serine/threonine protein kinase [Actinomycetota bacterium]|nr:serine/threonine protein kinase [Actinomycetota bacterium]
MIGDFRLERVIGRGGMGVVFLARQLKLDRDVALKVIAPELARDPELRARFRQETTASATLNSPYVVPVYDAGEADGELYIAMRYIEGSDLGSVLASEGVLDPSRAARIVSQVGAALDSAHAQGLVHRDVKPGNILLSSSGRNEVAYLSDFGLLRRLGEESVHGSSDGRWVGTVDYAAPEQIEGRPVDRRADVYSLGCVLFRALAGQAPFRRETPSATMWAHVNDPAPDPRSVEPSLPAGLGAVIGRALAKDPCDRFATAGELARAALATTDGGSAPVTNQLPVQDPSFAMSAPWSGSAAYRATHREPSRPTWVDQADEAERSEKRNWWKTAVIAAAIVLVLFGGTAGALVATGTIGGDHTDDEQAEAIRGTAKKSVATADATDKLAGRLGSLSKDLGQSQDAASRRKVAKRAAAAEKRAKELQAEVDALQASEGAKLNRKMRVTLTRLKELLGTLGTVGGHLKAASTNSPDINITIVLQEDSERLGNVDDTLDDVRNTVQDVTEDPLTETGDVPPPQPTEDTSGDTDPTATGPDDQAPVPTEPATIRVDEEGNLLAIGDFDIESGDASVSDAVEDFGPFTEQAGEYSDDCTFTWEDPEMTIRAGTLGSTDGAAVCDPATVFVNAIVIRSPAFATESGVQVGTPIAELMELEPQASTRFAGGAAETVEGATSTYRLTEVETPIGDAGVLPTVLAHTDEEEVVALEVIPQLMGE